jgi:cbb3-type cytochrome c oxidase subunit III
MIRVLLGACLLCVIGSDFAWAQNPGQVSFNRICRACHGAEGRGGGEAPALVPMSRELEEVLGVVREGFGEMPPISSRELNDVQVGEIVTYLKSLGQAGSPSSVPRPAGAGLLDEIAAVSTIDTIADATRTKDVATLGRLYHEMSIHSDESGTRLAKMEWLKAVAEGHGTEATSCQNPSVRVQVTLALVECRAGNSGILWVLIRNTEGWQVIDRHAIRVAP